MTKHNLDNKSHLSIHTPAISHVTKSQSGKAVKLNVKQFCTRKWGHSPESSVCHTGPRHRPSGKQWKLTLAPAQNVFPALLWPTSTFPSSFIPWLQPLCGSKIAFIAILGSDLLQEGSGKASVLPGSCLCLQNCPCACHAPPSEAVLLQGLCWPICLSSRILPSLLQNSALVER